MLHATRIRVQATSLVALFSLWVTKSLALTPGRLQCSEEKVVDFQMLNQRCITMFNDAYENYDRLSLITFFEWVATLYGSIDLNIT